jgi:predicted Zn-dependent peptidase
VLGPPPSLRLAPIQHLKLSNGLPVLLCERHAVPIVQMNIVVRAGSVNDPTGKPGLASMTAAMMMEGAGTRNALALAEAVEYLGASITVSAGYHTFGLSLNTPVARLDSALALLADVTLRPAFPPAELDRKRQERLTSLLQWRDEPRMLASVAFSRAVFGTHPYAIPSIGTEQSLRSFTPADLREFHSGYIGANAACIVVVGDVNGKTLIPRLEVAFGKWKPVKPAQPLLAPIAQVAGRRVLLIDKPGAPQTEIRIGCVGLPRRTDDYYSAVVMNTILGGSFSSRLNQNLREKHGYTYGAGSRFDFRQLPGPFLASAAVQTAVTDSSLIEFMQELRGILTQAPQTDLDRARNYVALSFPGDFQTDSQIAVQIEDLFIYDLPDDTFNRYIDRILAVSRDDVNRVALKTINPDNLVIVVVGDRAQIMQKIVALNLGQLTIMSVDDVLGKAPDLGAR